MEYKNYIIPKLKRLREQQLFLLSVPEQKQMLRMKREAIRGAKTDGDVVDGTISAREDMYITSIFEEEKLDANAKYIEKEVAILNYALEHLPPKERRCITAKYINQERDAIEKLCEELGYEQASIYRMIDSALASLARMLTGSAEV